MKELNLIHMNIRTLRNVFPKLFIVFKPAVLDLKTLLSEEIYEFQN